MSKEELLAKLERYFDSLEAKALQSDTYFMERNKLYQENQKLKKRIEEDKEDISNLMSVLNKNCSELKCTSDEWLVIKLWQDRLGGDEDD